jgi:hypothetical protein
MLCRFGGARGLPFLVIDASGGLCARVAASWRLLQRVRWHSAKTKIAQNPF